MAFNKKTWTDRVAEFINRRSITHEDGSEELVTVARSEGTVSQEGDAFNAATMNDLEERIEDEFESINSNLAHSRQLLWSNPNPNVAFSSNINLSSNDYDELEVVYYLSSTITNTKFSEVFEKGSLIFITKTTTNKDKTPTVRQRMIKYVDDTHYETIANGCAVQQTNSANSSVDYTTLVPIEIYGIKHYSR